MVVNTNKILDEGQNKFIAECKMKATPIWRSFTRSWDKNIMRWHITDDLEEVKVIEPNPDYIEPNRKINQFLEKFYHHSTLDESGCWILNVENYHKYGGDEELIEKFFTKKEMADHLGIIPFNPCVMINISPDWKGIADLKSKESKWHKNLLDKTINDYLNACNRYSKYRYCIECGGEGNFLHAHIVAEINPALAKSVKTHINKGNHKYELQKIWNKNLKGMNTLKGVKGIEGCLKGKYAVQRILINNPEMRDDKLNYLIETNKPEGHTNLWDMNWVKGDF